MRKWLAGIIAGVFALAPAFIVATQAPAHADPCFFTDTEFSNWYNGDRWDASLSRVENGYANCVGAWDDTKPVDVWNGHLVYWREWPQQDGGHVWIKFGKYDNAPTYRAHDAAMHGHGDPFSSPLASDFVRRCEWPRVDGSRPCTTYP
jgi:hypothetical protein